MLETKHDGWVKSGQRIKSCILCLEKKNKLPLNAFYRVLVVNSQILKYVKPRCISIEMIGAHKNQGDIFRSKQEYVSLNSGYSSWNVYIWTVFSIKTLSRYLDCDMKLYNNLRDCFIKKYIVLIYIH